MADPEAGDAAEPGLVAWFHCFSGVAGDMALGSLVDAGADLDEVSAIVRRVSVDGWSLEAEPVLRSGVAATKVHVRGVAHEHHHRTWRTIRGLLDDAGLPERVHRRATAAFEALARAEGALHRMAPEDVHFHEVGAIDAIVDIVGTCAALEVLGVAAVKCSPIALGRGRVHAAHGHLPNPAPAVLRILAEVEAPAHGIDTPVELTTPTGAALMASLAGRGGFGAMPDISLVASGYGAGTADPDGVVNATQVVLGREVGGPGIAGLVAAGHGQPLVGLEATVDDATGEVLAAAIASLLAAGAVDAWIAPVVGKKGRPAHVVSALADQGAAPQVAEAMRVATGSLGVRATAFTRWPAARSFDEVEVGGHPVRIKVSPVRAKAEHDDVVAAAATMGLSVPEVAARAEATWWSTRRG